MMKSLIAKLASVALPAMAVLATIPTSASATASVASCGSAEELAAPSGAVVTLVTVDGTVYEVTGKVRGDANGDGILCLRLHGNGHIKVSDDKTVAGH